MNHYQIKIKLFVMIKNKLRYMVVYINKLPVNLLPCSYMLSHYWSNSTKVSIQRITICAYFNKISKKRRNIYDTKHIHHKILEIDIDWTLSKDHGSFTFWRFGMSIYNPYSYSYVNYFPLSRAEGISSFFLSNGWMWA